MDFLGKINAWIPLVAVLFAGAGLVAVVLILAVTGCALRKRLVPQWLIWTYFIFSTMVIFAHDGSDLATVVADMEIPCLVVLLCYLFRTLFYRRPRYTYVEHTVYARAVAKGRAVAEKTADDENDNVKDEPVDDVDNDDNDDNDANEKDKAKDEELAISRKEQRKAEKAAREYEKAAREAERVAREAEEKAAAEKERAEREIAAAKQAAEAKAAAEVEAAEKAAREAEAKAAAEKEKAAAEKERAAREIAAAKKAAAEKVAQNNATTTTSTFALPVVEPIPDKTYVATSEPTITVTPVSETMPELKMPNTNIQLRYNTSSTTRTTSSPRPVTTGTTRTATVSSLTTRPTTTTTTTVSPNRTVTTETTTTPLNAYTAMYNPRVVKTTTTTTTTTTNTNSNTLNAVSATRTVNGKTTGAAAIKATSTSSTSTTPRSTEDIMAAIERLRANMKK